MVLITFVGSAMEDTRDRASRVLTVAAILSGTWALIVAATGGFVLESGVLRISSRSPRNATVIATIAAALAFLVAPSDRRRRVTAGARSAALQSIAGALRVFDVLASTAAPVLAAAICAGVVAVGLVDGSHVAGAGDSYAYASQADLWRRGALRVDEPLMADLRWPFAREALAPLGYRPALDGAAIVPVYPAGLPIVMAMFAVVAGRHAVFYVVPVLGGLAVWATYLMGRQFAGRAVGLAAAVLIATSPVFLYQLVQPMSDVPVTAWWALTLALLPRRSAVGTLGAGLAAGAAILTRANLAPLLGIPAAFIVWRSRRMRSLRGPFLFGAGALPGCVAAAALNALWYGSPFENGYGRFDDLYQWGNFLPNLATYPRWLIESQTPIVVLAVAAPLVVRARDFETEEREDCRAIPLAWLAFIVTVFGCYVFYAPFDAWWYLRFLLPAFPPLMVLVAVVIAWIARRVAGRAQVVAGWVVVLLIAWHGARYAKEHAAFDLKDGEQKYAAVGRYIANRLPARGVFLSVQHSGSVRYYADRLTVRFDWIEPKSLDSALDDLRRLGYQPYFVLDEEEQPQFKARFAADSRVGAIDWSPLAKLQRTPSVMIYDPAGREASDDSRRAVEIIPLK